MLVIPSDDKLTGDGKERCQRCDGERTVASIVIELAQRYGHEAPAVEREVLEFLQGMADRGLVQATP